MTVCLYKTSKVLHVNGHMYMYTYMPCYQALFVMFGVRNALMRATSLKQVRNPNVSHELLLRYLCVGPVAAPGYIKTSAYCYAVCVQFVQGVHVCLCLHVWQVVSVPVHMRA